jgi:hypothetical protein
VADHDERKPAPVEQPTRASAGPAGAIPISATRADAVLALQRAAGNRATTRLLQRVSADGTITDPAEMEASRPVGGGVDLESRVRPLEALWGAPRSRAILEDIQRMRGDLNFAMKWSQRGTFHRTGEIWLDRTANEARWMASLAHELIHLQTYLAGRAADIMTMEREAFVTAKMTDEVNAHAAGYVSMLQLGATTATPQGFQAFRLHLAATAPDAIRRGEWDVIEAAARTWLETRYRSDPAWRTSNTRENYYDYWGGAWDRKHPPVPAP